MDNKIPFQTVGIDILQDHYHLFSDIEGSKPFPLQRLPSVLLPLYGGEKGIFGLDALHHRRARGWKHPNECCMFWNNDIQNGCGRVPLVAAMQRLVDYHQLWGITKETGVDTFCWQPFQKKQFLSASEMISNTLQTLLFNTKAFVGLPLPDCCSSHVQQILIHAFNKGCSTNNCSSKLLPIRRSIAQAMLWCHEHQDEIALKAAPLDGLHVGHLLVINASMDCWEARLVPLQWHLFCKKFYLLPVDSENYPHENLLMSGWQLACQWLSLENVVGESLWQTLIGHDSLHEFLNQLLTPNAWARMRQIKPSPLPHSEDLFKNSMPEIAEIKNALEKLQNKKHKLKAGENSKTLGVIVDGCCAHLFDQLDVLPHIHFNNSGKTTKCSQKGPSLAAQGAQLYAKCRLEGVPSYLEELIPVDIWCRNSSRYGQEFIWKTLISKSTIPAGHNSQLESCYGFILPAGQAELQWILRRPSAESSEEYEYRKISAKIYEKFNKYTNVIISVEIKPGNGPAEAKLLCDDGHQLAELKWKDMKKCDPPSEHQSAYLARTCEALCDAQQWREIAKQLVKLNLNKMVHRENSLYLLQDPLESIYELLKTGRVKLDKQNSFHEWRIISGEGKVESNYEQLDLLVRFAERCYLEADNLNEINLKKRALQVMCPLFSATSTASRKRLLIKLNKRKEITKQELLCIGFAFHEQEEIQIFFKAFLDKMLSDEGNVYFWLRALRAILRYRAEAFDPEITTDILYLHVWTSIVTKLESFKDNPKIFPSALQCLIYLLGRRRFDKKFIELESRENLELNQIIKTLKQKPTQEKLLSQLEKLLNCNAEEEDVQLLLSAEAKDSDN